jgi:hypothetical protein
MALCWANYVSRTDKVYFTDGVISNVTVLDASTGSRRSQFNYPAADNWGFDNVEFDGKLYVLTSIGSVDTFNLDTNPPALIGSVHISEGGSDGDGMIGYVCSLGLVEYSSILYS